MDESANKGKRKLLSVKGNSDAAAIQKSLRIRVSGYNHYLSSDKLEMALRKHFSSCGEITDVYIYKTDLGCPPTSYINLRGEGALDKALKLDGTDLGGEKLHVELVPEFQCLSVLTNYTTEIGRIIVWGYDTKLALDDVESALRKHFASCGEITDVFVPSFERIGYVYFLGEGAVDKALKLNGSDVGGWKVFLKPYDKDDLESKTARFYVEGYDTKLSEDYIRRALTKHFSSCGKIWTIWFYCSEAIVTISGIDIEKKTLKLNGSQMGGCKLDVKLYSRPAICTAHRRTGRLMGPWPVQSKKAKTTAE